MVAHVTPYIPLAISMVFLYVMNNNGAGTQADFLLFRFLDFLFVVLFIDYLVHVLE